VGLAFSNVDKLYTICLAVKFPGTGVFDVLSGRGSEAFPQASNNYYLKYESLMV
jgi:hypothetical protein